MAKTTQSELSRRRIPSGAYVALFLIVLLCAGVTFLLLWRSGGGGSRNGGAGGTSPDGAPAEPAKPPVRFRMSQRRNADLPGFSGELRVRIGDITRGQVDVNVNDSGGHAVLGTTSLSEGDAVLFSHGGHDYRLRLEDLENYLIGADQAVFELSRTDAGARSPEELIELLIERVEKSSLTFIRNGAEHSADDAAAHLRRKREFAGSAIRTPEEFISAVASKSSLTGRPYLVKLPDGTTVEVAAWLRAELEKVRAEAPAAEEPR